MVRALLDANARILTHLILIAWCLVALIPLYFLIATALKTENEYQASAWSLPTRWTLANFEVLFGERGFGRLFVNSLVVTSLAIVVTTCFAVLAAFAIAQIDFPGRSTVLIVNNALMGVPIAVIIIPTFLLMSKLHLVNSYASASIIYVGLLLPWSIYLLTRFFERIPRELLDAAVIDGCGDLGILVRIVVPLSYPALATVGVTNFLVAWNELLIALVFLQDQSVQTLMPGVMSFFARFTWQPTLIMAALCLVVAPVIVLYLLSYRVFVVGVGEGAVK